VALAAILFDLDQTLHDRVASLPRFARDQYARLSGDPARADEFVACFVALDAGGQVWKDKVYERLVAQVSLPGNLTVAELVADYLANYPHHALVMPGAATVLPQLRAAGLKIGLVTNGRSDLQRAVIGALELESWLDATVISAEGGCRKPAARIFHLALAALGSVAAATLMVGDSYEADVAGAEAAGLWALQLGPQHSANPAPALATLSELPTRLTQISERLP
jgi:putative hydrolase of the HAD superfamily